MREWAAISATGIPAISAARTAPRRSRVGVISFSRMAGRSFSSAPSQRGSSFPISSERIPFRSASLNVRPMAIASPTDFIWVVRVRSARGNFSNAKRGIFTTT